MTKLFKFKCKEAKKCFRQIICHYKKSFSYMVEGDVEKCVIEVYDWDNFKQKKKLTHGIRKTK